MLDGDWEAATKDDVPMDPTTNMPTLPEGMFWMVTEAWSGTVYVNLMQYTGRKYWGTTRVLAYRLSNPDRLLVQRTAKEMVLKRRLAEEDKNAVAKVVGTYPPNKLNI